MDSTLASFTDVLDVEICDSQPISLSQSSDSNSKWSEHNIRENRGNTARPCKGTGQNGQFRSIEEIDPKYRDVFTYKYFNLVQSKVIDDALYSDKSIVVCAPTGSGKTVVFEMAIVQLLMELEDKNYTEDFKIIYMAPVKALCTERLTEWYPKFTKLGLMCIEVTGDTDVDFSQLQPYKIIITTPEKWDMLTRRWRDHRSLVEVIKLFLIDEVHILNDATRGPVLEAVVSRMKTIESSAQSVHRIEKLQNELQGTAMTHRTAPSIRFVAVSATVSNPEDVAEWLGTTNKPSVFHKFGDECRPVKLNRIVEGYPCPAGTSIFKFDIILNYKLWPIIQKYHRGKSTLIFCNTRKSVTLTAETLSRELTINFNMEQKAKLTALASNIKNKQLQSLVLSGVGCHHAGLLYEERQMMEHAFRNRDLPILITTTTLAMGVNLPAHLVIIKNTQQYVNGTFQEYSISTVLQMVGRAGRPQFDTDATAVIMTRLNDKNRYQSLVGGCEPLQSYLHKRLPENLNSEAALGTVGDVAQCVQWLRSTFLYVRAARDPKRYLGLPQNSQQHLISKKIEELCVKAMNGLASSGLITMDEASCIESTEAGRLMSIYYLDLETMKLLMRMEGNESLEDILAMICESHELSDMHLRIDERRCLNALNRNNAAATIRFPIKGKINTRQKKLNCIIQAVLGCLAIPDPSLNQEAMKVIRIADRVCKCLVAYVTRPDLISRQRNFYSAVLNSILLAKCITAHLWENSPFVSKQLKGIGPTFSTLLATAGKVNFMLLEESHPRDLERIMNKGPPAGNVLRRQISLLPKYQLSMTPIDENFVLLRLELLNQTFLAENIEHLTAGGTHKCYIIVGDSTNHLLLLVSFRDSDLLGVFDGTITHEIRRQHNCEHKIFAHCISSAFAGLDAQSEYVFKDLHHLATTNTIPNINSIPSHDTEENKNDTYRKRKRKKSTETDKSQSKEKKKRENAVIKNFESLKKTFENHFQNRRENIASPPTKEVNKYVSYVNETPQKGENFSEIITVPDEDSCAIEDDDFVYNDEKINNILNEIENEMSKNKSGTLNKSVLRTASDKKTDSTKDFMEFKYKGNNKIAYQPKTISQRKAKSNYTFLDLLERNLDLSDDDEHKTVTSAENNGFSDTIKDHIRKYMQRTETKSKPLDLDVNILLANEDYDQSEKKEIKNVEFHTEEDFITQKTPLCKMKEIRGHEAPKENYINYKGLTTTDASSTDYNTILQSGDVLYPSDVVKQKAEDQYKTTELDENILMLNEDCHESNKKNYGDENIEFSNENDLLTQKLQAHYEIKEIIGGQDNTKRAGVTSKSIMQYKNISQKGLANTDTSNNITYCNKNKLMPLQVSFDVEKQRIETKPEIKDLDVDTIMVNEVYNQSDKKEHRNQIDYLECNSEENILTQKLYPHNEVIEILDKHGNANGTDNNNISHKELIPTDAINTVTDYNADLQSKDALIPFQISLDVEKQNNLSRYYENNANIVCVLNKMSQRYSNQQHNIIGTRSDNVTLDGSDFQEKKNSLMALLKGKAIISHIRDTEKDQDLMPVLYGNFNKSNKSSTMKSTNSNNNCQNVYGSRQVKIAGQTTAAQFNRDNVINMSLVANNNVPQINCQPFYVNNDNDSDLTNSTLSKLPYHKNRSEYIRKYSFSTKQVDVKTKETADCSIKVIKEIKMDLNITEIVSSTKKVKNKSADPDMTKLENLKTLENDSTIKENEDSMQSYFDTVPNIIQCTQQAISKNTENNDDITKELFQVSPASVKSNINEDFRKNTNPQNKARNTCEHIESTSSINDAHNCNKSVNLKHYKQMKENENHNTGKTGTYAVQNILQKYSHILGKELVKETPPVCSAANKKSFNKQSPLKSTKPFKISQIKELKATIPETLINSCKDTQDAHQYIPMSMQEVINESMLEEKAKNQYDLPHFNANSIDEPSSYHHISNIDLEPLPKPSEMQLEPDIDYDIDQSMFDPKTLLQCTVNSNEEIITPPPQFCDYNIDSRNEECGTPNVEKDFESFDEPQLGSFTPTNKDFDYNESIFEDDRTTNLTPTREIETWTLGKQDDSWDDRNPSLSINPEKYFTVTCKNSYNPSVNKAMSRYKKLSTFKFTHKSKLRK